jgi:hypothetical protein
VGPGVGTTVVLETVKAIGVGRTDSAGVGVGVGTGIVLVTVTVIEVGKIAGTGVDVGVGAANVLVTVIGIGVVRGANSGVPTLGGEQAMGIADIRTINNIINLSFILYTSLPKMCF